MRVVYSDRYQIDIGPHVFPTEKYRLVCQRLLAAGVIAPSDIVEPQEASREELALVHTGDYLRKVFNGTLGPEEIAGLELPWSEAMVRGFRLMAGGTIDAACLACGISRSPDMSGIAGRATTAEGIVCHVGGGLHHAFPGHGEGFCPFNDVAIAARVLQQRGFDRIAIVDLDVHHGNGTAFTFNPGGIAEPVAPESVFTFSMHQQHNYPVWKPRGSLDIGLPDKTHDRTFLGELERALPKVMAFAPRCAFYLAGADPYEDDQLGGLRLTQAGLLERDRMVVETIRSARVPLVITLAGGYARRLEDTVAIHAGSIGQAARVLARAS